MSEISEEERRNYEYLMEKIDKKGKKKLSKKQKKTLKKLSEKFKNQYNSKETNKEKRDKRENSKNRTTQRKFNDADINGKLMIIFGGFIKGLADYIKEIIVYLTAIGTVFYLYYKFDHKETSEIFPSDTSKYPYVFVEKNKDYDEQVNLTTLDININASFNNPIFKKVDVDNTQTETGSLDFEKMKNKINQPDNAKKENMNIFSKFFNYTSNNILAEDVNLIQIIGYTLLSGIVGAQQIYGTIHNIIKDIYQNNKIQIFSSIVTFFLITLIYFLFRFSKNDLSELLIPIIDPNILNQKIKNVFGLEEIIDLFSSLFSGFFSAFKILFVASFILFISSSSVGLYKLSGNLVNLSSVFIIFTIVVSFCCSVIAFFISISKQVDELYKNPNNRGITIDTIFESLFYFIKQPLSLFNSYISGKSLSFMNVFKDVNFNEPITLLMFALSIPLIIAMIPFMLIPLIFILFFIIFSIMPFIASLYLGLKTTFDITVTGILNLPKFSRQMTNNYIIIALSFLFSFFIVLNKNKSDNIVSLIQSILNSIFFVLTTIGILFFGKYNQLILKEKDQFINNEIEKMSSKQRQDIIENKAEIILEGTVEKTKENSVSNIIMGEIDDPETDIMNKSIKTEKDKKQKLKVYVKQKMKTAISTLLAEKIGSYILKIATNSVLPYLSGLIPIALLFIVNNIKKYKSSITKIPIRDINLFG